MTDTTSSPAARYGVHSEVGKLRKVLVCSPGLAHERLTPTQLRRPVVRRCAVGAERAP